MTKKSTKPSVGTGSNYKPKTECPPFGSAPSIGGIDTNKLGPHEWGVRFPDQDQWALGGGQDSTKELRYMDKDSESSSGYCAMPLKYLCFEARTMLPAVPTQDLPKLNQLLLLDVPTEQVSARVLRWLRALQERGALKDCARPVEKDL